MGAYLKKLGHNVITGKNGLEATELYLSETPDLVLMDVIMPEMDGHEAARVIRQASNDWVPIIFLSGRIKSDEIAAGIEAGGDDYLTKPVDFIVLEAKMNAMKRIAAMRQRLIRLSKELKVANSELKKLVNVDGLTGISNRRYMDKYLGTEIKRSIRNKQPITVIIADVDHFKLYNDNYGHLKGDDCLKRIAHALSKSCKRATDVVARYGGEEFAIIMPDTSAEGGMKMAELLRVSVENLEIAHDYSSCAKVCTLSAGVYSVLLNAETAGEKLLHFADKGLYKAKEAGRNQIKFGE